MLFLVDLCGGILFLSVTHYLLLFLPWNKCIDTFLYSGLVPHYIKQCYPIVVVMVLHGESLPGQSICPLVNCGGGDLFG